MSSIHATAWAGLDAAKLTFDAGLALPHLALAFTPSTLRSIPVRSFARTREGATDFVAWARRTADETGSEIRVVMEATGAYSIELTAWLTELAPEFQPAIANPKRTCAYIKSLGVRNKTDKLEARALALYGLQRQPAPYEPLTAERAQLRSLLRYRDALVQARVAERLRADEPNASALVRKLQKRRLAQLERDIKKIEDAMRTLIKETPKLQHDCQLLTSIYGVGFLTACVIIAEIGDLRRFSRARQLSAFAGLSPRLVHSGTSLRRSHLCKEGNGRVRQALYMAATTTVRGDNDMARQFQKLRDSGKAHKPALTAVMRKLLTVMRAVIITETAYQTHHDTGGKLCVKAA